MTEHPSRPPAAYQGSTFLIDDENGSGWAKVTEGMGSPEWGHGSLPPSSWIVRERSDSGPCVTGEQFKAITMPLPDDGVDEDPDHGL